MSCFKTETDFIGLSFSSSSCGLSRVIGPEERSVHRLLRPQRLPARVQRRTWQVLGFPLLVLALFSHYASAQWAPWEDLGGQLQLGANPTVIAYFGEIRIFARGPNDTLLQYRPANDGSWHSQDLGGKVKGDPSCVLYSNSLQCFVPGPSGEFLHGINPRTHKEFATEYKQIWRAQIDTNSGSVTWTALPGLVFSRSSAMVGYHDDLKLFAANQNGTLIENDYDSVEQTFSGWKDIGGGTISGSPACSPFAQADSYSSQTELIGCFARDRDGILLFNKFTGTLAKGPTFLGTWSGWFAVPNAPSRAVGDPSATAYPYKAYPNLSQIPPSDSELDVFYDAGAGQIQHGWLNASGFQFQRLDGIFYSGACSRTYLPKADCVARGFSYTNGVVKTNLYHRAWLQPAPQIKSFSAVPTSVQQGGNTTLSWDVPVCDPRYCTIGISQKKAGDPLNDQTGLFDFLPGIGSKSVGVKEDTSYELITSNGFQYGSYWLTVKIVSAPPPTPPNVGGTILVYASFQTRATLDLQESFSTSLNGTLSSAPGQCPSCSKSFTQQSNNGTIGVYGDVSVAQTTVPNLFPGTWTLTLTGLPGSDYVLPTYSCSVPVQATHITVVSFGTNGSGCQSTIQ